MRTKKAGNASWEQINVILRKIIYFCFIEYTKASDCGSQQTVENS